MAKELGSERGHVQIQGQAMAENPAMNPPANTLPAMRERVQRFKNQKKHNEAINSHHNLIDRRRLNITRTESVTRL